MDSIEKNIAVARGEAMAASLLASLALQTMVARVENKDEVLARMADFVEASLNKSGPATGNPDDEFNTQMREIARFQAMQHLDAIARMLSNQR